MKWSGLYTALITPFNPKGKLDEEGLRTLMHFQRDNGADGVVVLGSTGEAATLSLQEKKRIIEIAREEKGEMTLVVGTGSNATDIAVEQTQMALDLGADLSLIVTPYYNKPTQEGLYRHYETIAKNVSLPFLIYHIPARTASTLEISTLKRLSEIPRIIGIKDSIPNVQNTVEVMCEVKLKRPDFVYFGGDDPLLIPMFSLGADGIISASGNVIPKQMKEVISLCQKGTYEEARKAFYPLYPIMKALFSETNPIGVKAALELMQKPAGSPRLPLTTLTLTNREKLKSMLQLAKIIP